MKLGTTTQDVGLGGDWRAGLRYGALGLPLAFVALPLYVLLPSHYSQNFGVPLASLGLLLLLARLLDALIDPLIGRAVDHLLAGSRQRLFGVALVAAVVLATSFLGLMFPPVSGMAPLLGWAALMLGGCYLAFSGLTVLHQAWGARLGGDAGQRAGVVAWREGLALAGVVMASVLPGTLGLAVTCAVLALTLLAGLIGLFQGPAAIALPAQSGPAASAGPDPASVAPRDPGGMNAAGLWAPLRNPRFVRLLVVYLLNGVASALPATLVLFFIRDRLQAPALEPVFLGAYFVCAALSLPLWVRAAARWGLARSWLLGMGLSVLSFLGAASLGSGDTLAYLLICIASGAALGADLSAPPALLAGLLRDSGASGQGEGSHFGWWGVATKLNLALAAGVALPLLQALGYQPGAGDGAGVQALALVYGLLPCLLKLIAAAALYLLWIRQDVST